MLIRTEHTPNPSTRKFIPGRAVMDAGTRDFPDAASAQAPTVLARRVRLVRMQLAGSMPGTTAELLHLRHRIQQGKQLVGVVDVGPGQALSQWVTLGVDEKMMLDTRLRSVRRVGPRCSPFLRARTLEESAEARRRSRRPFLRNSASSSR